MTPPLLLILPASNEAALIGPCLAAVLAQGDVSLPDGGLLTPGPVAVIVAANACRDATAAIARDMAPAFAARGWSLHVEDSPQPGKLAALNRAEALAETLGLGQGPRAYLDADVICDPDLLARIRAALDRPEPAYATGTLAVMPPRTWVTRAYAQVWTRLPFVTGGAVGAGFFAVNPAGRARWGAFPDIISDDTFVRLHFAPGERHEVPARYQWPLVEGWSNLVRVRRRQDAGVVQLARLYPGLMTNEAKPPLALGPLLRAAPLGFAVYALVRLAVRLTGRLKRKETATWTRGR